MLLDNSLIISAGVEWTRYSPAELLVALDSVVSLGFTSIDIALDWSAHEKHDGDFDFVSPLLSLEHLWSIAHERSLRIHVRLGPLCVETVRGGGVPARVRAERDSFATRTQRAPELHLVRGRVEPKFAFNSPKFLQEAQSWVSAAANGLAQVESKFSQLASVTVGPGTSPVFFNPDEARSVQLIEALLTTAGGHIHAPAELRAAFAGPAMDHPVFHAFAKRWALGVALPAATSGEAVIASSVRYAVRECARGVDFSVLCATPGLLRPVPPQHAVECAAIAVRAGARSISLLGIAGGDAYIGSVIDERGQTRHDAHWVREFLASDEVRREDEPSEGTVVPVAMGGVTSAWLAQLGFVRAAGQGPVESL